MGAQSLGDAPLEAGDPTHCSRTCLTLLASRVAVKQGIEQQLEGGGRPQVVEQLQDVGFRQEPFASIEGLRRENDGGSEPYQATEVRPLPSLLPPEPEW